MLWLGYTFRTRLIIGVINHPLLRRRQLEERTHTVFQRFHFAPRPSASLNFRAFAVTTAEMLRLRGGQFGGQLAPGAVKAWTKKAGKPQTNSGSIR